MVVSLMLGWGHTVPQVMREEWFAKKVGTLPLSKMPISHILYQATGTKLCATKRECYSILQGIQKENIESGQDDIIYNFMVGGDGAVYKGRGWHFQAPLPSQYDAIKASTISIGFIGSFDERNPPLLMCYAALNLILFGIKRNFVKSSFQLIPLKTTHVQK